MASTNSNKRKQIETDPEINTQFHTFPNKPTHHPNIPEQTKLYSQAINPVPETNPPYYPIPTIPLIQIIESFRTFDGSIPAEQWLRKFESEHIT